MLAATATAQRTWIVDRAGGPGVDFREIQPAVTAAGAGDRVEVRGSGSYGAFVIGSALEVVALEQALVPYFVVEGLAHGAAVRVGGFLCQPQPSQADPDASVLVRGCAGTVLLTDLVVWCRSPEPSCGFVVRDSACVAVQDCRVTGRAAGLVPGGPAILVERSGLSLVRTTALGGAGGATGSGFVGYDGGPGVAVDGASSVQIADSTIAGGDGGYGLFFGGLGGDAIVAGPTARVTAARSTVAGGFASGASGGAAARGPARVTADCALTGALLGGASTIPARTMLHSDPRARRGGSCVVGFDGPPGTLIALCFDVAHAHHRVPGLGDPLLLSPACAVVAAATLHSGSWTVNLRVPDEPALRHGCAFLQGVALEPAGTLTLTLLGFTRID